MYITRQRLLREDFNEYGMSDGNGVWEDRTARLSGCEGTKTGYLKETPTNRQHAMGFASS
jgi:hypothetical protein